MLSPQKFIETAHILYRTPVTQLPKRQVKTALFLSQNFPSALRDIVVCDVPAGSDQVIYELVALNQNTNQELNRELFGLLCAAAERTLFAKMLKDENIPTSPKHFIELAEIHRYRHDYCDLRLDPKLDAFVNLISL
ncbi:hypothetical protein FGIG_12562 [Fasciola gigantica]|uniref:Uncharacterized protein n=1 Tax=Fasciola gigantica TaxID=46835 RepID=A0A504YYM4_FASGI|nr:hypothetical protein FGIG_12562 [Fasciola gigantica]